jgi:hypothetical protein
MTSHHEKERYFMSKHSHKFVDEYDGLVGFGLSREVDEHTLTYYLQKFSDDQLMALIRSRMSEEDMEELFNLMGRLYLKMSLRGARPRRLSESDGGQAERRSILLNLRLLLGRELKAERLRPTLPVGLAMTGTMNRLR